MNRTATAPADVARAALAIREATAVAAALADRGVRVVALKGLYLAARCWPLVPRAFDDIDLLVSLEQRRQAGDALLRLGYRRIAASDGSYTYRHAERFYDLDLHWSLFPSGLFQLLTAGVLGRSQIEPSGPLGPHLALPWGYDALAHAVGHFVKGRLESTDVRRADFDIVARVEALSAARAAIHLEQSGLARAARYVCHSVDSSFIRDVVLCLQRDLVGDRIARLASPYRPARFGVHLLNGTLLDGVVSACVASAWFTKVRAGRQ